MKFSKHNAHVMFLCSTLHICLGRPCANLQALKDLSNISAPTKPDRQLLPDRRHLH